jgi:hypothetical protein
MLRPVLLLAATPVDRAAAEGASEGTSEPSERGSSARRQRGLPAPQRRRQQREVPKVGAHIQRQPPLAVGPDAALLQDTVPEKSPGARQGSGPRPEWCDAHYQAGGVLVGQGTPTP